MMVYELDDAEKDLLMQMAVDRARADLNDGKPLTEMRRTVGILSPTGPDMCERMLIDHCAWCGAEPHKDGCFCRKCPSCTEFWKDTYRTDYSDGRPATKECPNCEAEPSEPRPGERIQTWFCEDCRTEHTGSVLGGLIGDPHGEGKQ